MIIRKSAREIEQMAARGRTRRRDDRSSSPSGAGARRLDARARPPRRGAHSLEGRRPDLEGLQGLPGDALHLAERDGRARDPDRLPARSRATSSRSTSASHSTASSPTAPSTFPIGEISAEAQRLLDVCQRGARRRHRAGARRQPPLRHLPRRPDRRRGGGLLGRAQPRRPRRRAPLPRGPADPELRRPRARPDARRGDDARDRADDHRRRPGSRASHADEWSISSESTARSRRTSSTRSRSPRRRLAS